VHGRRRRVVEVGVARNGHLRRAMLPVSTGAHPRAGSVPRRKADQ
jgi:hypothetical protein